MKNLPQIVTGGIGGLIGFLYGELSYSLLVLAALAVIDFITGLMGAAAKHEIDSSICLLGITKKVYLFVLVAIGHVLDVSLNSTVLMNIVIFFYIANESISIVENAAKTGLPIPEKLVNVLKQIKDKEE